MVVKSFADISMSSLFRPLDQVLDDAGKAFVRLSGPPHVPKQLEPFRPVAA